MEESADMDTDILSEHPLNDPSEIEEDKEVKERATKSKSKGEQVA